MASEWRSGELSGPNVQLVFMWIFVGSGRLVRGFELSGCGKMLGSGAFAIDRGLSPDSTRLHSDALGRLRFDCYFIKKAGLGDKRISVPVFVFFGAKTSWSG
jgi:hypothetical protein